jgi:hypothetical protein
MWLDAFRTPGEFLCNGFCVKMYRQMAQQAQLVQDFGLLLKHAKTLNPINGEMKFC